MIRPSLHLALLLLRRSKNNRNVAALSDERAVSVLPALIEGFDW